MITIIGFIYSFLNDGFPLVLITVPFYLFLRLIFLHKIKSKNIFYTINFLREVVILIFFIFLVLLSAQTFIFNEGLSEIKLIPFQTLIQQIYKLCDKTISYGVFIFNVIGNIMIFVPIGIFLCEIFKTNIKQTSLFGFLISLTIEGTQLSLNRTTDIDDLILNTLGTVLGYVVYKGFNTICKNKLQAKN